MQIELKMQGNTDSLHGQSQAVKMTGVSGVRRLRLGKHLPGCMQE